MDADLYPPCQCWVCVSLREGRPPEHFTQVRAYSPEMQAYARERGAYQPTAVWDADFQARLKELREQFARDDDDDGPYDDDW